MARRSRSRPEPAPLVEPAVVSPRGGRGSRMALQAFFGLGAAISFGAGIYILVSFGQYLGLAAIALAGALIYFFPTGPAEGEADDEAAEGAAVSERPARGVAREGPKGRRRADAEASAPIAFEPPVADSPAFLTALRWILVLAAVVLAVIAQVQFGRDKYATAVWWLAAASGAIFLASIRRPVGPAIAVRRAALAAVCLLAFGFVTQDQLAQYPYGSTAFFLVPCAIAAALCVGIAFFGAPEENKVALPRAAEWIGFALVLVVAAGMRLYRLQDVPNGIYLDEGDQSMHSIKIVEDPAYRPFFVGGGLRVSAFHNYWLSLFFQFLGTEAWTMRLGIAVIGMFTVAAFYFLAREIFHAPLALLLGFLFAVSHWHVNFSRFNANAIYVPLFECVLFYCLLRGVRTGKWILFLVAGLAMGLGMYTYFSWAVVWPLPFLFAGYLLVVHTSLFKRRLLPILGMAAVWLVVYLPFLNYQMKHPGDATARFKEVSVFNDLDRTRSYEPLRDNLRKCLLMVNWKGDPRPRHNYPHEPMGDKVTAVLFALGVAVAVFRFWKPVPFLLLAAYWGTMQAGVWSLNDAAPHSLRQIANAPLMILFVGLFLNFAWGLVRGPLGTAALLVPVVGAVAVAGHLNAKTFFHKQYGFLKENPASQSVYYDYSPQENEIALWMRAKGADWRFYLEPAFDNYCQVWFYNYRERNYEPLELSAQFPLSHLEDRHAALIAPGHAKNLLSFAQHYYRGATLEVKKDPWGGELFAAVSIPKEEIAAHLGLRAEYFSRPRLQGVASSPRRAEDPLSIIRGRPAASDPGAEREAASARYSGTIYVPRSGNVVFTVQGIRLTVDGSWRLDASAGSIREGRFLGRGAHEVTIEADQMPVPLAALQWETGSGPVTDVSARQFTDVKPPNKGLYGRFWRGSTWQGSPVYGKVDPTLFFEWTEQIDPFMGSAPMGGEPLPDPFSAEWTATLDVPDDGYYAFGVKSVHGSQIFVDNQMLVDNLASHDLEVHEGRVTLKKGPHTIRVRFFHEVGGRKLEVWWVTPGGVRELLPWDRLTPLVQPVPIVSRPARAAN